MTHGTERIPYRIHADRFDDACRSIDRRALLVIAAGAGGGLFGTFWVIFGVIVWGMGVASTSIGLLLIVVGGLLPLAASALVMGAGIAQRMSSSRLRDLAVLASRYESISPDQLATALSISPARAEALLTLALRRGMVSAVGALAPRR